MDTSGMEGLWIAHPKGDQGKGICLVVARDGQILGGDTGYHFGGVYRFVGDRVDVTISSKHFAGPGHSIFGWRDGVGLTISGFFNRKHLLLGGHFHGDNTAGEVSVEMVKLRDWVA